MERGNFTNLLDYGRYFVPAREHQIETVCDLIPASNHPFTVFELCCAKGCFEAILAQFPLSKGLRTRRFSHDAPTGANETYPVKDRFHSVHLILRH